MSGAVEFLNVDPVVARDHFAQNFDLNQPEKAMTSYQRLMHEHTKQQFETATASSRRRSSGAPVSSLNKEDSMRSSASSSSS